MKRLLFLSIIIFLSTSSVLKAQRTTEEDEQRVRVEVRDREREKEAKAYAFFNSTGDETPRFISVTSSGSSSQLSLAKTFTGETKKNEGSFTVDESIRQINFMIQGKVRTGSITIKLMLPKGDVIKDITIDESADITFSQNIRISEDENKYTGKWSYTIEAVKAEGNYRMSINTK